MTRDLSDLRKRLDEAATGSPDEDEGELGGVPDRSFDDERLDDGDEGELGGVPDRWLGDDEEDDEEDLEESIDSEKTGEVIQMLHNAYRLLNALPPMKPIKPGDDNNTAQRTLARAISNIYNACEKLGSKPSQKT